MGRHKNLTGSCPRHGSRFMVTEKSGVKYCAAPTPGELTAKCFFHPTSKYAPNKDKIDNDPAEPNVLRAIEHEWEKHKQYKQDNKERMRKGRSDVQSEIQPSGEVLVESSRNTKRKNGINKELPALTYESIVEDDDDIPEDGDFLE